MNYKSEQIYEMLFKFITVYVTFQPNKVYTFMFTHFLSWTQFVGKLKKLVLLATWSFSSFLQLTVLQKKKLSWLNLRRSMQQLLRFGKTQNSNSEQNEEEWDLKSQQLYCFSPFKYFKIYLF